MTDMLMAELSEPRPGQRVMLEHLAWQFFIVTVRETQWHGLDSELKVNKPGIEKALSMMRDGYRDHLKLDNIAQSTDMSKFSMIHHFKEITGLTPYEWLQQYRLARACDELLNTRRTVLDIALDHGFRSISSFNRIFRRTYGLSPAEWRQLHQKNVYSNNDHNAET